MSPGPPGGNEGAQRFQIDDLAPGYVYSFAPLPTTQSFNLDANAQDSQHDTNFYPNILTDEETSTGQYTICCVVIQLIFILQTGAAHWVNLQVRMSIDQKE